MLSIAVRTLPCANARPPRISTSAANAKPRPTSSRPITGSAAKPATTRNSTVSQPLASSPTFRLVSLAACAISGAARIRFDSADVPAVAVHDRELVAQRPLDTGVVRGRDLDGHPVVSRLRD